MLYGGGGNDRLVGDAGRDFLSGGAGADTFAFSAAAHTPVGAGRDIIRDFVSGVDHIDLSAMDADFTRPGNQAFQYGYYSFSGTAGELIAYNNLVQGDLNGDRIADFQVAVADTYYFSSSDFIL